MAGSSVIGALRVNLGLDSAQFQSGAKKSSSAIDQLRSKFKVSGAAIAAAATAAGVAVTAFAVKSAADIDKTAKAARRIGESIAGFRAMELAAGESGVEVGTLTDGVQTMNRELAKGGKNATSALAQLGIDAEAFKKQRPAEQLATLADAIQETGASSGKASALLQNLGVRNKEMVLALVSGGAVFRDAAKDIADYGLAMSDVDASSIEAANDKLGRLSLIGKYLGDQLAIAVVPALGKLAKALTDSLREGGLLRAVLDAIAGAVRVTVNVISALVNIVSSAVSGFVYLAGVLGTAVGAATGLSDAFVWLGDRVAEVARWPIVRWIYDVVTGFSDLITATGSFSAALGMLGDVAAEVWRRIGDGASYVTSSVAAMSANMDAYFIAGLRRMAGAWVNFTWAIADGLNSLFGTNLRGASATVTQELGLSQVAAENAAKSYKVAAEAAASAFSAPLASVQVMKDTIASSKGAIAEATDAVGELSDSLDGAGGKGGKAAKEIKAALTEAEKAANRGADSIGGMFSGLLDRSKTLRQGIADLILEIAKMQLMNGFKSLFGAGGAFSGVGTLVGNLIGANAAGTEHWRGGLTAVNERGGEIMDLPNGTRIIPHDVSNRMAASMGARSQAVDVAVQVGVSNDGNLQAFVTGISKREAQSAAQGAVRSGLALQRASKDYTRAR